MIAGLHAEPARLLISVTEHRASSGWAARRISVQELAEEAMADNEFYQGRMDVAAESPMIAGMAVTAADQVGFGGF